MGIKGEIDSNTIVLGDFKPPTYINGQIIQREKNKESLALNDRLDYTDLISIYTGHSIKKQKTTYSFQGHMEHSPG